MRILAVDDEELALLRLENELRKVFTTDMILTFGSAEAVRTFLGNGEGAEGMLDYAFLDIRIGSESGIELAGAIRAVHPECRFFFCTEHSEYAFEAFKIYAIGYMMKPVTAEGIRDTFVSRGLIHDGRGKDGGNGSISVSGVNSKNDKNGKSIIHCEDRRVFIRTFGNFDLFLNNRAVKFNHSKAKELLAYLVDRRGSGVTSTEAYSILWEDDDYTPSSKDKVQHVKKDLRDTLARYEIGDILVSDWNWLALDVSKVSCDYYDFLEDDPRAMRYYNGEYMSQYSWAEHTIWSLDGRKER